MRMRSWRLTSRFVQVDLEFTHAEVGYPHVSVVVEQNVVELQVTVVAVGGREESNQINEDFDRDH